MHALTNRMYESQSFPLLSLLFVLPSKNVSIYKKGWIDFNKNGVKDVYENPFAPIDAHTNSPR